MVLTPAGYETPHSYLLSLSFYRPHPGRMERKIKVKLVCWDKNSAIIENKRKYINGKIMLIIIILKKRKEKPTKQQVMHNANTHHSMANARLPFLNPDWSLFQITFPSLYTIFFIGHGILWCGISLWSVWFTCPGCAASQFAFCLTNLLTGKVWDRKKVLDLG